MLLHSLFDKIRNLEHIIKTEQTTIVYTRWDRKTSYDVLKHASHSCNIEIALNVKRNVHC